jgi:hypothetical protein
VRSRERPPGPWIQARTEPSIAGQKTSPAGAPPHSKLRTEQWADRPMPGQGANLCPCILPSTPWTDANGSFPPLGRRLGISHSIWLRRLSVHLIDNVLQRNKLVAPFGS